MGSTDITVDQGGSGGSDALQTDGYPMRRVAAEARRVLLEMGVEALGVPVSALAVSRRRHQRDRRQATPPIGSITYGELIGGKKFNVTLTGRNTDATTGIAQAEAGAGDEERRQVAAARRHPAQGGWHAEVGGGHEGCPAWCTRATCSPPVAGATLVSIDESSVKDIPGFVKVVSKGNYVAVVCEREENAIRAARQLKVEWKKPATAPFPTSENLFTYMRGATPSSTGKPVDDRQSSTRRSPVPPR